jgi:YceI-like domain
MSLILFDRRNSVGGARIGLKGGTSASPLTRTIPAAAAVLVMVVALSGCPTGPHGPGTPPATAVGQPPSGTPGAFQAPGHEGTPYDVVSGESLLTILAFKGGALAKAGHNHVIASHDVSGTFYVPADVARSTFELHVPVAQLTIDEPGLRAQEGPDFPTDVPDSAKEGTRHNMLGEALLDGAQYPEITLVGQRVGSGVTAAAAGTALRSEVQITVRGQAHTLSVPLVYSLDRTQLVATGELPVRQSELGLTPFSALLGALQVQDELHVRFHIVARPGAVHKAAD